MVKLALLMSEKVAGVPDPGHRRVHRVVPRCAVGGEGGGGGQAGGVGGDLARVRRSGSRPSTQAKVPDAPEAGAVKVTVTPDTGLPCELVTLATRGDPKAVLTVVYCGAPEETAMAAAVDPVMAKKLLIDTSGPSEASVAISVYPTQAVLIWRLVKVATPATAAGGDPPSVPPQSW